jgi:hypothetical protein
MCQTRGFGVEVKLPRSSVSSKYVSLVSFGPQSFSCHSKTKYLVLVETGFRTRLLILGTMNARCKMRIVKFMYQVPASLNIPNLLNPFNFMNYSISFDTSTFPNLSRFLNFPVIPNHLSSIKHLVSPKIPLQEIPGM